MEQIGLCVVSCTKFGRFWHIHWTDESSSGGEGSTTLGKLPCSPGSLPSPLLVVVFTFSSRPSLRFGCQQLFAPKKRSCCRQAGRRPKQAMVAELAVALHYG
jgi:hypothetical protein